MLAFHVFEGQGFSLRDQKNYLNGSNSLTNWMLDSGDPDTVTKAAKVPHSLALFFAFFLMVRAKI
jgi:hypothetical protein